MSNSRFGGRCYVFLFTMVGLMAIPMVSISADLEDAVRYQEEIQDRQEIEEKALEASRRLETFINNMAIEFMRDFYKQATAEGVRFGKPSSQSSMDGLVKTRIVELQEGGYLGIVDTCTIFCDRNVMLNIVGIGNVIMHVNFDDPNTSNFDCMNGRISTACICRFGAFSDSYSVPCGQLTSPVSEVVRAEVLAWLNRALTAEMQETNTN